MTSRWWFYPALLAVSLAGLVSPEDVFAGLGHPAVVTVAAVGVSGVIMIDLATFVMKENERPYLHPVRDRLGNVVLTEDKPADHPWQHGISEHRAFARRRCAPVTSAD